ncbi:MAG: PAS-domain containing protein [Rhodospirillales bacterium]|nr:PAS-domain containing protein [Rhodospirillales bacterium]
MMGAEPLTSAWRPLLAMMPAAALVVRAADGRLLGRNARAAALLGEAATLFELCPDVAPCRLMLDKAFAGAVVADQEIKLLDFSGAPLWMLLSAGLLGDGAKPDEAVLLVSLADITTRKLAGLRLAGDKRVLDATLEHMSQGIAMFDAELRCLASNRRFFELCGLPADIDHARCHFEDLVRYAARQWEYGTEGDIEDHVAATVAAATSGVPLCYEHVRPNGMVLEIRSTPLPQGGFVRTYTDITDRKRAEQEAVAARRRAEEALAELKAAQGTLIETEKMASLGGLVAGVAHEINTPVGVALTAMSLLAERTRRFRAAFEDGQMKRSDLKAYVECAGEVSDLALANINRAAELIQSFKQVAVDRASAERRPFPLGAYLGEVLSSLRPQLRRSPIEVAIECREDIAVDSYPGALAQVVTNLVMNAVVHAFPEGRAGTIRISTGPRSAGQVEIAFADDGKGIPPENLGRIFEPFFTTRRGSGGSGLGLHIVYNLVTQTLGGTLSVASMPGQGTTFTLRLPLSAPGKGA